MSTDKKVETVDKYVDVSGTESRSGRNKAEHLVAVIRVNRNPILLGFVVREMIRRGVYGTVEIAFFQRLAEILLQ